MHVVIHALEAHVVDVSAEAKQAVRLTFNPSANKRVERFEVAGRCVHLRVRRNQ